ncbi:phage major capsid protein [Persephonella sp.]
MANRVLTTTNTRLLPKVVDTVLGSNVFATRMLSNAQKWIGEKIKKSLKISKSSQGGSFDNFDVFSTNAEDTRRNLEFEAKFYRQTVVLPLSEISKNKADEQRMIDLIAVEMASSAEDMADGIGNLFYGDGTGNSGKDFLGLEGIVDDGTNVATYGGLSRATYSTLNSTVTASGGTLSLAKMATLYSSISSGSVKPTLGLCSETVFDLYEQLLQSQERIAKDVPAMRNGLTGGTGFTGLYYKGFPILADEKATAGTLYFVNEDFLEFRALPVAMTEPINFRIRDIEGNDYTNVNGLGFSWSGWIKPTNQASVIGHIYLGGELWSSNPKRHGKLTGITSI